MDVGTLKADDPIGPTNALDCSLLLRTVERARQGANDHADVLNRRLFDADLGCNASFGAQTHRAADNPSRVAVVSLLFNWPSNGGGIVHMAALIKFLTQAGYDVFQFFAVFALWRIGKVECPLPYPAVAIEFDDSSWNKNAIQQAFRQAVGEYSQIVSLSLTAGTQKACWQRPSRTFHISSVLRRWNACVLSKQCAGDSRLSLQCD
jgi:hypothetical protein